MFVLRSEMAAEKSTAWPNKKSDYELRDVIGEQLDIFTNKIFDFNTGLRCQ